MQPPYGHPPQPPMMQGASGAGVRICPSCGIIAPLVRNHCGACKASYGAGPTMAAGRVGPLLFACFHDSDFACNACGNRSPLPSIETNGQAECLRCGIGQAFDVVQWTDALAHAHNTVDLAGPSPDGQNPVPGRSIAGRSQHAKIGTELTSSTKTQNGMIMDAQGSRKHTLRTTVSPGHPLCTACRVPLEVSVDGAGGAAETNTPTMTMTMTMTTTTTTMARALLPGLRRTAAIHRGRWCNRGRNSTASPRRPLPRRRCS